MGNWENIPIGLGGDNIHVEHFENEKWIQKMDFPFANSWVAYFSLATMNGRFYLFGKYNI